MYDAASIKKEMEVVCKKKSNDVQVYFQALMVAKSNLVGETQKEEYEEWIEKLHSNSDF